MTTSTSDTFQDSGRLKASSKRATPADSGIDVFIVQTEAGKVFRITGDRADAERYAEAYVDVSSHRGGVATIHHRTVNI